MSLGSLGSNAGREPCGGSFCLPATFCSQQALCAWVTPTPSMILEGGSYLHFTNEGTLSETLSHLP